MATKHFPTSIVWPTALKDWLEKFLDWWPAANQMWLLPNAFWQGQSQTAVPSRIQKVIIVRGNFSCVSLEGSKNLAGIPCLFNVKTNIKRFCLSMLPFSSCKHKKVTFFISPTNASACAYLYGKREPHRPRCFHNKVNKVNVSLLI